MNVTQVVKSFVNILETNSSATIVESYFKPILMLFLLQLWCYSFMRKYKWWLALSLFIYKVQA